MFHRSEDILDLSISAGEIILTSGGEISRVENTIERIAKAYGAIRVDAFATPLGIFVTVQDGEGICSTQVRRIRKASNDLDRLDRVNSLSREIHRCQIPMEDAKKEIKKIQKTQKKVGPENFIASGIIGTSFAYIFGGALPESVAGFFAGLLVFLAIEFMARMEGNVFYVTSFGGFVAGLCGVISKVIFPAMIVDKVIIGSIMVLVPGMAITGAIRDLMAGDLLSGVTRTMEAFLTAVAVAVGVALALGISFRFIGT